MLLSKERLFHLTPCASAIMPPNGGRDQDLVPDYQNTYPPPQHLTFKDQPNR